MPARIEGDSMNGRTEATGGTIAAAPRGGKAGLLQAAAPQTRPVLQMRFLAIWLALAALLVIGGLVVPRSLVPSNIMAVIPLAAFLTIATMGQTLVLMTRGIDLSVPAVITLSSTLLLGVSGGS